MAASSSSAWRLAAVIRRVRDEACVRERRARLPSALIRLSVAHGAGEGMLRRNLALSGDSAMKSAARARHCSMHVSCAGTCAAASFEPLYESIEMHQACVKSGNQIMFVAFSIARDLINVLSLGGDGDPLSFSAARQTGT